MQKKSIQTLLYSTVGVVAMALILIGVNLLTGLMRQRVDLTDEKIYTLSDGTRAILGELDSPVKIRFYCTQSESTTPEKVYLKGYARTVEDLLNEYKQAARGNIVIEKYDPQPDSDAEDSARLDGIEGQMLSDGDRFYLGLTVSRLDVKEALPFLQPNEERLLEYKLSRAISRVVTPEKPVVGIMSPLPIFGVQMNQMMMQMGQQGQPPWALLNELRANFTVKRVEMTADTIDDDIKVLLVVHPKEITDEAQFAIDQFVLRGGKLIAFLDAQSLVDNRNRNQMFGNMGGGGSSLDKLLTAWGVSFDTGKCVADLRFKMQTGGRGNVPTEAPAILSVTPEGINHDDPVTSQIDNVWLPCAGAFTGTPVEGLKETVLLHSSKDSQLVDSFMASMAGERILQEFQPSGTEYALAIRLTGKFKTAFPDGKPGEAKEEQAEGKEGEEAKSETSGNWLKESASGQAVVLVGDADMLYDMFTIRTMQSPFGMLSMAMNANLNFAQNAVEQMSGDSNLIDVRSRATQNRPFEVVKEMEAEANRRFQGEIAQLQRKSEETQRRLSELQAQKDDKNQRFILSPEQQAELVKLEQESAETNRKLREVQKDLRREINSLETRVTWWNILAMPVVVSASGIVLAAYKRKLTGAK